MQPDSSTPPAVPSIQLGHAEPQEELNRASSASSQAIPALPPKVALAPTWLVSEPVQAGDLLVIDALHSGELRRASSPSDPNVIGIAAEGSVEVNGSLRVTLVDTLYPSVKADATAAPIHPGDLLVSAATPGHVMRAPDGAALASIVGKAMQALESGTGLITISRTPR